MVDDEKRREMEMEMEMKDEKRWAKILTYMILKDAA